MSALPELSPVPDLLRRIRGELSHDFDFARRIRVSRAPGRLDVMGGIADYTGSLVCELPLACAAAVALQERSDRVVQVFSFNLLDQHLPFTLRIPLDALAGATADQLRRDFDEPGRKWAAYLAGCLFLLHEQKWIDLNSPSIRGMNLALLSDVPMGAGVSSSAAIEVAAMMNLVDHFQLGHPPALSPEGASAALAPLAHPVGRAIEIASLCQQAENRIVGAPCGIMDQVTGLLGEPGMLLRLKCQPHELLPPLKVPDGLQFLGINSGIRHAVGGRAYIRTRCAAFMGHRMLLEKMREMGDAKGWEMERDPMKGYLANLPLEDYKRYFRNYLPGQMSGRAFLERFGSTFDTVTRVDPDETYHVLGATDHHVYEARRVQNFAQFIEEANTLRRGTPERSSALDKAGHLMYASHVSYTQDAQLGADECGLLVDLVRANERAGLYGARITGGGSGGTVAVLANDNAVASQGIQRIMAEYQQKTGQAPELLTGSTPGAWHVGTAIAG